MSEHSANVEPTAPPESDPTAREETSLRVENISKSFRHVDALVDISLELDQGEVVGLVGENGAGKSTLLNILTGVLSADDGQLYRDGVPVEFDGPQDAASHGVSLVHQEQDVITYFRGYENLFLGRERETIGLLKKSEMSNEAQSFVDELGISIDVDKYVKNYSFNERQMLEIAKAFHTSSKAENPVILLDEPTAALEEEGRELLFDLVNDLRNEATFVFVSHELDEVLEITDRIYVLKDGELVAEYGTEEATQDKLQQSMVGRETSKAYYRVPDQRRETDLGEPVIEVADLQSKDKIGPVSFSVRRGEIFGIVGVEGSGKERLGRAIAGASTVTDGTITIQDNEVKPDSPADMVDAGVGYIPKDRKSEGLLLYQPVRVNTSLAMIRDMYGRLPFLDLKVESEVTERTIDDLNIKTPSAESLVHGLSGGNQQKVVIARWLAHETPVLVMDNVSRGIDVGAKEEVYRLCRELTDEGISIVLIGDELPEVIGLSNRIAVMQDGLFAGEPIDAAPEAKPTEEELIQLMV